MSVNVKFKTSELPCLLKAFRSLGWEIREDANIRAYSPSQVRRYPYVAVNPRGSFDVGLRPGKSGEDNILVETDTYDTTILAQLGTDYCNLKQQFGLAVLADEFGTADIITEVQADNTIFVSVSQY